MNRAFALENSWSSLKPSSAEEIVFGEERQGVSVECAQSCRGVERKAVQEPLPIMNEGVQSGVGVQRFFVDDWECGVEADDESARGFEGAHSFVMADIASEVGEELGADSAFEECLKDSGGIALKPYREWEMFSDLVLHGS